MRDENEEQLYWRGIYFPGTLNEQELEQWRRVVHKLDSPPTSNDEKIHWGYAYIAFAVILFIAAVFL